ncbi:YkgJ family cysteine cluster protein [Laceyella putida]|uniref:YkgJ family cysteine cluster protein n=1 Tax=Laceyella putida TaxID=110101 RepID=A0ABW2RNV8_9BACL
MEKLPCEGCKGMCCGPVPVTEQELKKIKKKIKSMPLKKRLELENQNRYYGTCIFYDLDNDKCGIYEARPEICRVFGYHKNLSCFRKPELATKDNWNAKEKHVGILSLDFTWKYFK